jgi:DNA invertase Pin-like site-specific DNA recombinase
MYKAGASSGRILALPEVACQSEQERTKAMSGQLRRIGYIRTSPTDHHPNVQADVLTQAGCTELHQAGVLSQQEALKELLDLLGDGDTLIVYRMDRLSRDEHTVVNFQQQLKAAGVELIVTSEQDANGENDAK